MKPPVVEVENLGCAQGWRFVVRDVSFQVHAGEIAVIVGVNGVGKSTLLATLAGALSAVEGSVRVFGQKRRTCVDSERAARKRTLYLPDQPWLPSTMLVREFLGSAGKLFDIPEATAIDRIDALLDLFGMNEVAGHLLSSLSTGQKKKAGLSAALLSDRELLLLDEPFSGGLDPAGIAALRRVLLDRSRNHGQTVILTTPVAEIVAELADRLLILRDGQLTENLTRDELQARIPPGSTLAETLNSIIFPEFSAKISEYLDRSSKLHQRGDHS
jgi:ABC-2 type transport system ATP-binding protein